MEGGKGTTTTTGALKEDPTTKMEDPKTDGEKDDELLNLEELLRKARYQTLEDQSPVAEDADYLKHVAKTVLAYLKRNDDNSKKFGLGCITTTLDISGRRRKVDSKVAGLLDLQDFLPVLEHFFTCEGKQVELNCLGAKVYCCMVEGIGCNHSLAWKIDQIDFLKQFFIMLSSNEEVLMEQAVLAFAITAQSMYLRPSLLACAPFIFSQLQVFMVAHPNNSVVRGSAICSILSSLLVAPREIRLMVEKAYKKRDNSFTSIMIRGGIRPRVEKDGSFVLDDIDVRGFLHENLTFKKHFPSVSTVQSGIPLMENLLESKNDKTLLHVLHALTYLLRSFKVSRKMLFLKRQICRSLVNIYERSEDDLVISFVCLSIEYLAGLNSEDMLLFLQNVKGTTGLKHYWKTIDTIGCVSPLDEYQSGIQFVTIRDFLKSVVSVIRDSALDLSGVNAIIDCGFHITFLNLLKKPKFLYQTEVRVVAISAIHSILASLSDEKARILCESQVIQYVGHIIDAITTDLGQHSPHSNALAVGILGHLVNNNSERRDKALKEGAVAALVHVLRKVTTSSLEPGSMSNVMCCLDKMVSSKPSPKLEDIKDLVGETRRLWGNMPPPEVSVLADVRVLVPLKVLALVTKSGVDGVDLIMSGGGVKEGKEGDDKSEKRFLLRRVISLTANSNKSVQTLAMEVILGICKGTTQHRRRVVEMGILKKFKIVLKEGSPVPRRISLNCLDAFITEDILTFEQKKFVQKELSPLAKAEEDLMLSETHLAAQFVNEKMFRLFYPFPPAPPKNYY